MADGNQHRIAYLPVGNEVELFTAAAVQQLPVLLKGPTGVGKTRFVEYMAEKLCRPLITVACHEDLSAADLIGRYLLEGEQTVWLDGPLTRAVKAGAICYLDEIVEARADTIVVLHQLLDHRRELHVDRLGQSIAAAEGFMLVLSYNPGYQSLHKELKPSTRQRLVGIEFDFPPPEVETRVLTELYHAAPELADQLVRLANAIRRLDLPGLAEVASTRALITTVLLVQGGSTPRTAATSAMAVAISDDADVIQVLTGLIDTYLP